MWLLHSTRNLKGKNFDGVKIKSSDQTKISNYWRSLGVMWPHSDRWWTNDSNSFDWMFWLAVQLYAARSYSSTYDGYRLSDFNQNLRDARTCSVNDLNVYDNHKSIPIYYIYINDEENTLKRLIRQLPVDRFRIITLSTALIFEVTTNTRTVIIQGRASYNCFNSKSFIYK